MKKLISICMMIGLLLISVNVFAEDGLSDKQAEAVSLMNDIGIYDGITEDNASSAVTRAEFAKAVAKLMGGGDSLSPSPARIFADVLPENDAAASVEYLYDRGIMNGYGNAKFKPDNPISAGEAIKVLVSVTGYTSWAEQQGSYPRGYYSYASSNGIIKGVSNTTGEQLTYAEAAVMLQNVLESDKYLKITGIENNRPIFAESSGKKYMEQVLGIYRFTDILEAYGNTSLYDSLDEYSEDLAQIGGEFLKTGDCDVSEYLGMRVKVYYKANSTDNQIIHITPDTDTKIIEVQEDDIDDTTTKTRFVYSDGNKLKTLRISQDAVFVYNGKRLDVVTDDDLHIGNGYVRLVSNDAGSVYDTVIITNYDTFVVNKASAIDTKLNFKYGRDSLDLSEDKVKAVFYLENEKVDFASITSGSVLSIAMSKNTRGSILAQVLISNNKITSTAKSMFERGGRKYVTLEDGTEYAFTDEYMQRLKDGQDNSTYEPAVGSEGDFYIDSFSRLAAYGVSTASRSYAYVVNCYYDPGPGEGKIRLFTKDSNFEDYELPKKLTFNGASVNKDKVVERLIAAGNDGTVNQLIIYKVNADGYITSIQTAVNKLAEPGYIATDEEFVLNAHPPVNADGKAPGIRFYKEMAVDYPFTYRTGETLQFLIPTDKRKESAYKIATKLSEIDISVPGPVYVYNVGFGGVIGAIVTNTEGSAKFGTPSIVDNVCEAVDEDGNVCTMIEFIGGQTAYVDENVVYDQPTRNTNWTSRIDYSYIKVDDLKRGDVITYTTVNGKVENLRVLVHVDDIGPIRIDGENIQESGNMVAEVISVAESGRTATVKYVNRYGDEVSQTMLINSTTYRYDSSDGKVYSSSAADMHPGDMVLINSFWWSPKLVVIFR